MPDVEVRGSAGRLILLGLLAAGCASVGLLTDHDLLLAMAEAMALVALTLLALAWLGARGVRVWRGVPFGLTEDDELEVHLRIERPRGWIGVTVEGTDRFTPDRRPIKPFLVSGLRRGQPTEVRYRARCSAGRGEYLLPRLELTAADPLGLFRLRRRAALEQRVRVYPRPMSPARLPLPHLPQEHERLGARARDRLGQSTVYYGTREYRPGMPTRHIHWRASARRDLLVVREFAASLGGQLVLLLDLARRPAGSEALAEELIRAAAGLAEQGLARGLRVGLIAMGGEPLVLRPDSGPRQRLAILDALAVARVDGETPIERVCERALGLLPEGAAVVLLSERLTPASLRGWVAVARRRGHAVLAVLPEDAAGEGPALRGLGIEPLQIGPPPGVSPVRRPVSEEVA